MHYTTRTFSIAVTDASRRWSAGFYSPGLMLGIAVVFMLTGASCASDSGSGRITSANMLADLRETEDPFFAEKLVEHCLTLENKPGFLISLFSGWGKFGCFYDLAIVRIYAVDCEGSEQISHYITLAALQTICNDPSFVRSYFWYKRWIGNVPDFDSDEVRKELVSLGGSSWDTKTRGLVLLGGMLGKPDYCQNISDDNVHESYNKLVDWFVANRVFMRFDAKVGNLTLDEAARSGKAPIDPFVRRIPVAPTPLPTWGKCSTPNRTISMRYRLNNTVY